MATIHIVSPLRALGTWDWTHPDGPGIGGSETMHCEIAWRLAERGHTVTSYVPLPRNTPSGIVHRFVTWKDSTQVHLKDPGLWIIIRGMHWLSKFPRTPQQRLWQVFQDMDLPEGWDEKRRDRVDRIVGLCAAHVDLLRTNHPAFADKIVQSRNGIRGDLVDTMRAVYQFRNPHRMMFASSPDRGLLGLAEAFRLIRFCVPDAELHVFYGWDNIDKLPPKAAVQHAAARVRRRCDYPGITLHGRVGQPELYREWLKTSLLVAPTNFLETGHISLMEAQALGAIPVVNPLWATGENLVAGFALEGDAEYSTLQLRKYAMAAVWLMQHPEVQDEMRGPMMVEARKRFDWEGVIDQYEAWMKEDGL